jgi:hypothetical protein
MTRNRPINLHGQRCECGAQTENGSPICRKCRSRARWLRRKTGGTATHGEPSRSSRLQVCKGGDEC